MRFRSDLTEKREKLTQNATSIHVSFMEKGIILPNPLVTLSFFLEEAGLVT